MREFETKPYKDHRHRPPISIYMIASDEPEMEKISCINCKRTVYDAKGIVTTIILAPMPLIDFGLAINARCKMCGQNYRILPAAQYIG